jgi:hypothetical protein
VKYQKLYGFDRSPLLIIHVAFTALTINLFNLALPTSPVRATAQKNLVICLAALGATSAKHKNARQCFRLTQILMQRWGIKISPAGKEAESEKTSPVVSQKRRLPFEVGGTVVEKKARRTDTESNMPRCKWPNFVIYSFIGLTTGL